MVRRHHSQVSRRRRRRIGHRTNKRIMEHIRYRRHQTIDTITRLIPTPRPAVTLHLCSHPHLRHRRQQRLGPVDMVTLSVHLHPPRAWVRPILILIWACRVWKVPRLRCASFRRPPQSSRRLSFIIYQPNTNTNTNTNTTPNTTRPELPAASYTMQRHHALPCRR